MNKIKILCAFLLILTVSACGGGPSANNTPSVDPVTPSVDLGTPSDGSPTFGFANAPGADGGTIQARTVTDFRVAFDELETAISNVSITAPSASDFPTSGSATLKGYIRVTDEVIDEITDEVTDVVTDEVTLGHLTITANFNTRTVETRATDFTEFDVSDPENPDTIIGPDSFASGELMGSGTIDRTTITSTLDGRLTNMDDTYIDIDSDLSGRVYDDDGRLVVHGTMAGTTTPSKDGGVTYTFDNGEFAASEARPSE